MTTGRGPPPRQSILCPLASKRAGVSLTAQILRSSQNETGTATVLRTDVFSASCSSLRFWSIQTFTVLAITLGPLWHAPGTHVPLVTRSTLLWYDDDSQSPMQAIPFSPSVFISFIQRSLRLLWLRNYSLFHSPWSILWSQTSLSSGSKPVPRIPLSGRWNSSHPEQV